jgi:hypothetical protein
MHDGLNAHARRYVQEAVADLQAHGVTVAMPPEDAGSVLVSGKLGGSFDENGPTFSVCAASTPELWLSTFIHEYQHFRQWRLGSPTWTATLGADCCAWYLFEAWLQGAVELTPLQLDEALRVIVNCERECEAMSIAEITARPELGIDPAWYCRAANVYLAFYGVVRLTRRWYDESPYADSSLIDLMPHDRVLAVEESLRPTPKIAAAILAQVYTEGF